MPSALRRQPASSDIRIDRVFPLASYRASDRKQCRIDSRVARRCPHECDAASSGRSAERVDRCRLDHDSADIGAADRCDQSHRAAAASWRRLVSAAASRSPTSRLDLRHSSPARPDAPLSSDCSDSESSFCASSLPRQGNQFIRPTLTPTDDIERGGQERLVGRVEESGDFVAREVAIGHLVEGDQGGAADAGAVVGQGLGGGVCGRRFRSGRRSGHVRGHGRHRCAAREEGWNSCGIADLAERRGGLPGGSAAACRQW